MAARHPTGYVVQHSIRAAGPPPDEASWTTILALESESRFREESAGVQAGKRYLVRDGDRWASWDADWGAVTHETEQEGGPPSASHAFLLDPVSIVGSFRLEPFGAREVAGREARTVRAVPRADREVTGPALFRIGPGADVVELAIDAERGALLRSEASLDGQPFLRLEVTEIAFRPHAPEMFAPELPAGAVATGGWPRPLPLPLHELASPAPFPVVVPGRVPEGWRLVTGLLTVGRERPPVEPEVSLVYASADGAYGVTVSERHASAPRPVWLAWEWEGDLETADAGEHVEPRHHVAVEREGTRVELCGADPTLLVDLAGSLVPAPTEPPRL